MAPTELQLVENTLHEIATHAYALATGLQNAAPPTESNKPIRTVQYLMDVAMQLEQVNRLLTEWSQAHTS